MLEQNRLSRADKLEKVIIRDNSNEENSILIDKKAVQLNGINSNRVAHLNQSSNEVSYCKFTLNQLFEEASTLLSCHPIAKIIAHFSSIYLETKKRFDQDRLQKLNLFLENGGEKEDFEYKNEYGIKFKLLLTEYKRKKNEYYQNLEKSLNENLVIRHEIINELKVLYMQPNDDSKIFEKFKDIKRRWSVAGSVPKNKSSDIYRTYYHHLENVYEYLDLNRAFKEKDFEVHLQEKLKLIERAQELLNEPNIKKSIQRTSVPT